MTEKIRVFILDDHELLRRGLISLLTESGDIDVVGESASARDAVQRIVELEPAVALLDVQLPDGSGIEVCRLVRSRLPELRVLMLTAYDHEDSSAAAAVAGASGFLLKQIRGDELLAAIRRVVAGEVLLPPTTSEQLLRRSSPGSDAEAVLQRLTGQERRVLDLIVDGLTNRQIGERLGIGEQTVKNYVTNVLVKLGLVSRTQAAVFGARARGL